jgi:ABC-type nitrate/sulfonate/bicarbonate transport system permease component
MVEIVSHVPPGGFQTVSTPPAVQQSSQLATDTNANTPPVYQAHSHVLRNLLIGSAIAVGLGVGLAVGTGNTTPPQRTNAPFKPVK